MRSSVSEDMGAGCRYCPSARMLNVVGCVAIGLETKRAAVVEEIGGGMSKVDVTVTVVVDATSLVASSTV